MSLVCVKALRNVGLNLSVMVLKRRFLSVLYEKKSFLFINEFSGWRVVLCRNGWTSISMEAGPLRRLIKTEKSLFFRCYHTLLISLQPHSNKNVLYCIYREIPQCLYIFQDRRNKSTQNHHTLIKKCKIVLEKLDS